MIKKIAILFLFLIVECSTFSVYVKDFFGEVISCNIEVCETDNSECESENQEKKSEPIKYLTSYFDLKFTFDVASAKKSKFLYTKSFERFPYRFVQSPPPEA